MDLLHLLSYARQPLVGAFTGYITTDVAIRLLFHPLKPWRIFGIRIPLTPGVFPAKRYEFAERVGVMVGSHLLTSEDVRVALQKEEFRRELKGAVDSRIDRLFEIELGTLESLFPADFQKWVRGLIDQLRHRGIEAIYAYLESSACEAEVERLLREMGDSLFARELHGLLSHDQHELIRTRLAETVRDFLRSPAVGAALAAIVERKLEDLFSMQTPVGALLPKETTDALVQALEKELSAAAVSLTSGPRFRELLSVKIRSSLKGAVASMHGVPGFFAKFLDPEWLLSLFPDLPRKIEEEVAAWVRDENTQREIGRALRERVDVFLQRPLSDLFSALPYRRLAAIRRLARIKAVRMLHAPQVAASISEAIGGSLDRMGERTVGEVLVDLLSADSVDLMRRGITREFLAVLRSQATRQAVEETLAEKVEHFLLKRQIGHLSDFMPVHARTELCDSAFAQLAELLVKEMPPLVDTLNVRKIVEEKINALDVKEMEGLLLDIMKESFMFLNIFSGLLGFLIGLVNLILPGWGG